MPRADRIKYDSVTVHFVEDREPLVVERVLEVVESHFPGSGEPALQIIDDPMKPPAEGETPKPFSSSLFETYLILIPPDEIDYLLLEDGDEERVAQPEDFF